jgi:hypothetical protein
MSAKIEQTYYELSEHNFVQIIIFFFLIVICLLGIFYFAFPLIEYFFKTFLQSGIYNSSGTSVSYTIDDPLPMMKVEYLTAWAIDIYKGTPEESRYWFNPLLSLTLQFTILSLGIATIITAVLPRNIGYIRQKIDREIANSISKISMFRFGMQSDNESRDIINDLLKADLQDLHGFIEEWNIRLDDLIALQKAIKWKSFNFVKRLIYFNDGIQMYMRFYFTVKYNNTVLGFVYMGAAVLIIIIGLRGLKFIPPTQPSLVLFALGLEFTLLVTYAITLMYTKQEETEQEAFTKGSSGGDTLLLSNDFGSSKDIEKLLRVFIKTNKKKK